MIPWEIRAIEFVNCNCSYGCPCQFNAYPTHGWCEAAACLEITEGHYGDTRLDGIRFGGVFQWPKAIHEGNGKAQPYVDERANPAQREAVLKLLSGADCAPMSNVFAIFASTLTELYEPVFAPIEFDVDVDRRRGRFVVPGVVETRGEPIKNPITGSEYRVRIDIPVSFEYEIAEIGSGTTKTEGKIKLDLKNTYGQFARLHLNNQGVVKSRAV